MNSNNFFRVTQYFCSCLLSVRLAYAITPSDLLPCICEKTTHLPTMNIAGIGVYKGMVVSGQGEQGWEPTLSIYEDRQKIFDMLQSTQKVHPFRLDVGEV